MYIESERGYETTIAIYWDENNDACGCFQNQYIAKDMKYGYFGETGPC